MSFDIFFMEVIKNFVDLVSNSSILTFLFSLPIIYICIRDIHTKYQNTESRKTAVLVLVLVLVLTQ